MPDVKISAGADPGTVLATDKVPLARSASTTAYAATIAELATYANGAYVPNYYTGSPSMDGTAAPGSLAFVARGDHVHPSDTARVAKAGDTMGGFLTLNANPTSNLHAATKQYVDGSAPVGGPYLSVAAMHDVGRNLIHNATMTIAQRGGGPFTTNGVYTLDRWQLSLVSDAASIIQLAQTDTDRAQLGDESAKWCLRNVFTGNAAAGAYNTVTQWVEDVRRLAGKTVTVSFWASCASGTPKLGASLDQYFGTPGGGGSAQVNGTGQSVTLSTTWTRYSLTFTVASISGKTISTSGTDCTGLNFWYSSGTTNATRSGTVGVQTATVFIWGVQLEIGSVATPLEKRDPEQELRQCQRFYQYHSSVFISGYQAAGTATYIDFPLPTTMRAAPTAAFDSTSYSNASAVALNAALPTHVRFNATMTALGFGFASTNVALSADL